MLKANIIADYFIHLSNPGTKKNITNLKLQKLLYYAQGFNLVSSDTKLFEEDIQAWKHGPVIPEVYQRFASHAFNELAKNSINIESIKLIEEKSYDSIIKEVWSYYGSYNGKQLERLTHMEDPWLEARKNLPSYVSSKEVITPESIKKYFEKEWCVNETSLFFMKNNSTRWYNIGVQDILIIIGNDLLDVIYPLITFLVPVIFGIVGFIYRERKDISYNTIKSNLNGLNIFFIIISIANIIFYISLYVFSIINDTKIEVTNIYTSSIIFIGFILLIYLSIHFYINMLSSINIFKLCKNHFKINDKNIRNMKKQLKKENTKKIKKNLEKYNKSSQIIGQVLIAQMEYDLITDFSKTLKKYLTQQDKFFNLVNFEYSRTIVDMRLFKEKNEIYKDDLDINMVLLEKVINNNKRTDMEKVLSQYLKLIPGTYDPSLDNLYTKNMFEIYKKSENYYYKKIIYSYEAIDKQNYFEMNDIFEELLRNSNDSQIDYKTHNIFTLYYVLIIQSVYSNNLKMLTNFINLIFILVQNQENNILDEQKSNHEFTYYDSLCKILIITMFKSIELGHHKCSGFLIKILVNHQKELGLNDNIINFKINFKKNLNQHQKLFKNEIKDISLYLLEELDFKMNISTRSFDYCYYKFKYLIFKQQKYLVKLKLLKTKEILRFNYEEMKVINKSFNRIYMQNKLLDMHKEYGMLALKNDENFLVN